MPEPTTGQAPIIDEAAQAAAAALIATEEAAAAALAAEPKTFDAAYVKTLRVENATARIKLKEFETAAEVRKTAEDAAKLADLSEVEQLKAKLADSEKRAKALEIAGVRAAAAAKHGLSADLHEFIFAEDAAGAEAQVAKLAEKLKPGTALPGAGGRNPANGGEGAAKAGNQQRFDALRSGVPSLNNRVLKD